MQQKLLLLGLHYSKVEESCIFDNVILFPCIFICRNNTLKWKKENKMEKGEVGIIVELSILYRNRNERV